MIRILDQWSGKFEVDGEIYNDLYDFEYKDGEEFHIKLLAKRRELGDGSSKKAKMWSR